MTWKWADEILGTLEINQNQKAKKTKKRNTKRKGKERKWNWQLQQQQQQPGLGHAAQKVDQETTWSASPRVAGEQPSDGLLKIFTAIYLLKPIVHCLPHLSLHLFLSFSVAVSLFLGGCPALLGLFAIRLLLTPALFSKLPLTSTLIIFGHLFINKRSSKTQRENG